MSPRSRLSIIVAVAVIAGLLATTWFVGVGPRLKEISTANTERETVEIQNAAHESTLAGFVELAAREGELKQDLDLLRASIPSDVELSQIIRRMDAVAEATGTQIKVLRLEGPTRYMPLEDAASTEAPDAAEAPEVSAAPGRTVDPEYAAALGSVSPDNFFTITVTYEIFGEFSKMLAAVEQLQLTERFTLVSDVVHKADDSSTIITGQMFVLLDAGTVAAPAAPIVPGDTSAVETEVVPE